MTESVMLTEQKDKPAKKGFYPTEFKEAESIYEDPSITDSKHEDNKYDQSEIKMIESRDLTVELEDTDPNQEVEPEKAESETQKH